MALVPLVGTGPWIPNLQFGDVSQNFIVLADTPLLDADEEEYQFIGRVHVDGGGSKTFGTSGSKVSWLPGASITFVATANLRVGVKSAVDAANGPVARATIGAAAFAVYKDLVGGTDTITSATWRDDAMAAGTPFTVADGDLIAICFHLDITANAQSIKVRGATLAGGPTATVLADGLPVNTLVTSGPTYTQLPIQANLVLTFDDGTLGWINPSTPFSVADAASSTIGNTNIVGNIFRVPFPCKIDALAGIVSPSTNAANFALDIYSTPLGTPGLVQSVTVDANAVSNVNSLRLYVCQLATPISLSAGTDYLVGVRQTTATAVTTAQRDVNDAAHFKPSGMGAECYAANSTAGATFAAQNSGKRRYHVWVRLSHLDDGAGGGGGSPIGLGSPVIRTAP